MNTYRTQTVTDIQHNYWIMLACPAPSLDLDKLPATFWCTRGSQVRPLAVNNCVEINTGIISMQA